jgi:GlcNAc-P-P-Und epimerase
MEDIITIIGGSGFVGTNLCKSFRNKGILFEIIDLKVSKTFPKETKIADVRDLKLLSLAITGNIIINLAAIHRDDVKDKTTYYTTNVIGAKNIITVSKQKNIKKIIFTSSVAVYGFVTSKTNEDGEISPFNEYGKTKFEAEKLFRAWNNETKNSLIIIRPTVIFGEGNRGNVFNLFNQIYNNRFIMIGNGKNKKSIAYIANVVAFIEKCLIENIDFGLFNYVDGPNINMNKFIKLIRRVIKNKENIGIRLPYWLGLVIGYIFDFISFILNKKFSISSIRVKKFCSSSEFTSEKNDLEDFVAPYSLEDGIFKTLSYEFLDNNPNKEVFFTE